MPLPIRLYADFQCFNQPQKDPKVLFKQIPNAVGFYLIAQIGNTYYSDSGIDCVKWFVNEMLTLQHEANNYFETKVCLKMTPEEELKFQEAKVFWLCEAALLSVKFPLNTQSTQIASGGGSGASNVEKVRDHDHLIGKYRGAPILNVI